MERGSDAEPTPVLRFVWRITGDSCFAAPDPMLTAHLGERAPQEGETLDALGARVGLERTWAEAVATRATFSRIRAVWPEPDGASVALISGAPAFGPGEVYQGYRGFGLLKHERAAVSPAKDAATPAVAPVATSAPRPPAGDAAALIRLLQRQHAPASSTVDSPALAVISALALLLQPKAFGESKTSGEFKPARRPSAPTGAEIVVLHPQSPASAPAPEETVELTSQERDNFKAIARALGANVRPQGLASEATLKDAPPHADEADEPASDDFAALVEMLPIAILVVREGRTLFANKTLIDIAGYRDLADFRARDGLAAIFRGRDPRALAPGGASVAIPLVAGGGRILNVDAQVRAMTWSGEPAEIVAMRRSYEAERQEEMRAMEREAELHAARARDYAVALEAARDGMVKLDRSGRILSMNKGAQSLFDRHQVEAAGESVLTLFSPADQPKVQAAFEQLVNDRSGRERLDAEGRAGEGPSVCSAAGSRAARRRAGTRIFHAVDRSFRR